MPDSDQIPIRLPDGSTRAVATGTTAGDLATEIGSKLRKAAVIATVNGVERDLVWPLSDGDEVAIVTITDDRGLYTIRHSTAHVLAQAVLDLWPGATFGIGPPVEDGFYYDFELPADAEGHSEHFKEDDLPRIEERMREIVEEQQPFVRDEIGADDARKLFKDHKYKLEIIEDASTDPMSATESGPVRTYENPPRFIDLCRGPHVEHTGRHLGHFKLMRVAGAYWRGDEKQARPRGRARAVDAGHRARRDAGAAMRMLVMPGAWRGDATQPTRVPEQVEMPAGGARAAPFAWAGVNTRVATCKAQANRGPRYS